MPIDILMPALSPTMTEGNLVKWLKKEGETLKSGDVIAEIETDKATMEVEAVDEGILGRIVVAAGTSHVPVNSLIGIILEEGETQADLPSSSASPLNPPSPSVPRESSPLNPPSLDAQKPTSSSSTLSSTPKRILSSPLARRLAQDKNIALTSIQGSGPRGRIVKKDIDAFSQKTSTFSSSDALYEDREISNLRGVIAKRLTESKQTIPHFYASLDVEMDLLLDLRQSMNEKIKDHKVSVNDFIIKACGLTLMDVPHANASWMNTCIRHYQTADVSVAVSIEGGLITPIIRHAQKKTILEISHEMILLREKAQKGKLAPHEFQGGGFSLSNMGMYGISSFSAIINPPQSCILAVGAARECPVVRQGALGIGHIMTVTLSVDHRVIDGSVAAHFLQTLKKYLERPILMFI